MNKKPRSYVADIKINTPVDKLTINRITGEIKLSNKGMIVIPESTTSTITYPREKSPKIVAKTSTSFNKIHTNPDASLRNYDQIFAIDTNRKYVDDVQMFISVTGIVTGKAYDSILETHMNFRHNVIHAIEFWNENEDIRFERVGWYEAIKGIQKSKDINDRHKIGIIVDSYLDDIPYINNRTQAIIKDFYLPSNFHLMYANSDKHNSSMMNKMIALSDKHATDVMNNILQNNPVGNIVISTCEFYKYIRHWKINHKNN